MIVSFPFTDSLIDIAPLTQAIALLFSAIDKEMYRRYRAAYEEASDSAALTMMTATKRECFQGLALVRNLAVEPHKDSSDVKNGWVGMCCWGEFTGGELVIPILGIKLLFQPGDVVFFRSALLKHYILSFKGERTSFVFFSHQDVV